MADDDKPEPLSVDGITELDYSLFITGHPVALMLFKFLRDYREAAINNVMQGWINNGLTLVDEHEARGYARALQEVTTIRIPEIARFYQSLEQPEEEMPDVTH